MRTPKELLTIVRDNLHHLNAQGLCLLVVRLYVWYDINVDEKEFLLYFIKANKPSKWSSWHLFLHPDSVFHWRPGAISPRRRWLKKHIKKL